MKFSEAINKFSEWKYLKVKFNTIYGYDIHLRHFCIFLRDPDIEQITLDQIVEFLFWNERMGFKASALQKKSLAIKEFLDFFGKQGYNVINYQLVPIPRKEYAMPRVLNDEDFEKLVRAIPQDSDAYYHLRNLAIMNLLHDSGARIGELISLNIEDIDCKKMEAIVHTEKDRSDSPFRKIFWYRKETAKSLEKWLLKREELLTKTRIEEKEALFISINGGCCGDGRTGRRMDIEAVGEMLRKYSRLAGLKYVINAHSFRHRVGHELARKGANNSLISEILGHQSLESSRIYTRLNGLAGEIFRKIMVK